MVLFPYNLTNIPQKLENFNILQFPSNFQTEKKIQYDFINTFPIKIQSKQRKNIHDVKLLNEYQEPLLSYYLEINNTKSLENGNYILLFNSNYQHNNDINESIEEWFGLYLSLQIKEYKTIIIQKNNQKEKKYYKCRNSLGRFALSDNIPTGIFTAYLYKEDPTKNPLNNNLNYLNQYPLFENTFIESVEIQKKIHSKYKSASKGIKPYYTNHIKFSSQNFDHYGQFIAILIHNISEFIDKIKNIQTQNNLIPKQEEKIKEALISSNIQIEPYIEQMVQYQLSLLQSKYYTDHPIIFEHFKTQLYQSIITKIDEETIKSWIQPLIIKSIPLLQQITPQNLLYIRKQKYDSIIVNNQINIIKLKGFMSEHQLLPIVEKLITTDYHWFVLNDVIEYLQREQLYQKLRQNPKRLTLKTIQLFEKFIKIEFEIENIKF